jgi:Mg2+ and Co2+ transporter CorA
MQEFNAGSEKASRGEPSDSRRAKVEIVEGLDGKAGLEGVSVGGTNLYMIVFKHGLITFHFEDVSKHTDRVRRRLLDSTHPAELSSDWIAHGLYDSAVDAFFPLLAFIEVEVAEIEVVTAEPMPTTRIERRRALKDQMAQRAVVAQGVTLEQQGGSASARRMHETHVKQQRFVLRALPRIVVNDRLARHLPVGMTERRVQVQRLRTRGILDGGTEAAETVTRRPRSLIQRIFRLNKSPPGGELVTAFLSDNAQGQSKLLRRITDARKLVTGLSRLLAPKNDAVRGLRKRLVELRGTGAGASEMSIYMGDVLDHIVTLLAHLAESDARLHQTHHTYLSAISLNNQQVAHSTDEILIVLATITVAIFGMQCVLGLGSMNVEVPHNLHAEDRPPGEPPRYWWFIGIVCVIFLVPPVLMLYVRNLKRIARNKTAARRSTR